jgi:hypothetical protein
MLALHCSGKVNDRPMRIASLATTRVLSAYWSLFGVCARLRLLLLRWLIEWRLPMLVPDSRLRLLHARVWLLETSPGLTLSWLLSRLTSRLRTCGRSRSSAGCYLSNARTRLRLNEPGYENRGRADHQ